MLRERAAMARQKVNSLYHAEAKKIYSEVKRCDLSEAVESCEQEAHKLDCDGAYCEVRTLTSSKLDRATSAPVPFTKPPRLDLTA